MLLSHQRLVQGINDGWLDKVDPSQVNGASVDLRLGPVLYVEDSHRARVIDLTKKQGPATIPVDLILQGPYALAPQGWALGATVEKMNLPDNIAAEVKLKSSIARGGLNHLLAGWIDPGFHGALTLELVNALRHHPILLHSGMPIVQVIFYEVEEVPEHVSYRTKGRYNAQSGPLQTMGVG